MFSLEEYVVKSRDDNGTGNQKFYPVSFYPDNIKAGQHKSDAMANCKGSYKDQQSLEILKTIRRNQSQNEQLMIQSVQRNNVVPAQLQVK